MTHTTNNNQQPEDQIVFQINFHYEYLGSMSLSIDEEYAVRISTNVFTNAKPKMIVTNISTGLEYSMNMENMLLPQQHTIQNVEFGPKYTKNSVDYHSIFVTVCDAIGRPSSVYVCGFNGEVFSDMELVVEDPNAANFVDIQRTKGCDYVVINSTSKTDNQVWLACVGGDTNTGAGAPQSSILHGSVPWERILVKERNKGVQYYIDCGTKDDVIILAHRFLNQQQEQHIGNGICEAKVDSSIIGNEISVFQAHIQDFPLSLGQFGNPIRKHSDEMNYFVEEVDLFENFLVLYERSSLNSSQRIRVVDRHVKDCKGSIIPIEGIHGLDHFMISPGGNMHFHSNSLHFTIETPLTPPIHCQYDFYTKSLTMMGEESLDRTLEDDRFGSERVNVVSDDGISIPLSFYFDKTGDIGGVVLIGYGSYGQNQNLAYDPTLYPLVKRGLAIVSFQYVCIYQYHY